MLRLVPVSELESIWPDIAALVADACETSNGRFLPVDVLAKLASGHWQIWTVRLDQKIAAIIVTQIIDYPRVKECYVRIVTGKDRHAWQHVITDIELWASSIGCNRMRGEARLGWARIAKHYGYAMNHVVLEKVI